ncbi:MAG: FAD:protein FMN transferase [Gammaproteobacteria bacterium]|nr:FAD:protein FMN transferase [Gammaproteobacteria bacterium]
MSSHRSINFLRSLSNRLLILRTAIMCESSSIKRARRSFVNPIVQGLVSLLILVILYGCEVSVYKTFQGDTMGTYYRVVGNCGSPISYQMLQKELGSITSVLSTYDSESEVSLFNRSESVGEWVPAHETLVKVLSTAQQVSEQTSGAFDVTVAPLVELWGFGIREVTQPPSSESIKRELRRVNYKLLELDESNNALRKLSNIKLDLSGIGKGYGVDHIAEFLVKQRCSNYLIDIGGEIRVRGHNALSNSWRIGIEEPDGTGQSKVYLNLSSGALATSGSYRNFRIYDETPYPHLIDPRSGYPTSHNLTAVTVYRSTATEADAVATALFVMGFDDALEFAESHDVAVALTTWDSEFEKSRTSYSTAMNNLIKKGN